MSEEDGVPYFNQSDDGCKAVLDKRDPEWKLPMVCGRNRDYGHSGARSPYCTEHLKRFTNIPATLRRT
jgi:hypothetical protein